MTLTRSSLWLALVVILAACSSRPAPQIGERASELEGPLVGPRWNFLLLGTDERLSMPERPHFVIDRDGRLSGSDGCGRLEGRVRLGDSQRIDVGELDTARGDCPKSADARRVTAMLENAYRYLIDHDRLVFFGPDQRVLGGWRRTGGRRRRFRLTSFGRHRGR
jgi:heat shock protein HslJ